MRFISKPPWIFITVAILLFIILKHSFYLRSIGYDQIPETFVILDERTNVWHGLSIKKTGIPSAWSNLGLYKLGTGGDVRELNLIPNEYESPNFFNFIDYPKPVYVLYPFDLGEKKGMKHLGLVQPYLDHPPLGALVLASFVSDKVKTFSDLTPFEFRKGSLWLGVVTTALIFFLGWQLFNNPWIGFLSASIYGTVPTFILLSRYALLENVLNPIMLLSLNLLLFSQRINTSYLRVVLVLAGIASGFAALTKIIGWFVLVIGILLLRQWKINLKDMLFFIVPSTVVGLLYFAWGLYLAPGLFVDIFRYQGLERGFIGSINFLVTSTRIGILNFPLDGWWIGGFLSLILIPFKKEYAMLLLGSFIVIITALFLGGANYPWYFIPLIPFMCIASAIFIWRIATNPNPLHILILFAVFISSSFYWGYGVFKASLESTNYQQPYGLYRFLLLIFISSSLGWLIFSDRLKRIRLLWFLFMVVVTLILLKLNERSLYFILVHWGKLPSLYTPGTF